MISFNDVLLRAEHRRVDGLCRLAAESVDWCPDGHCRSEKLAEGGSPRVTASK